MQSKIPSLNRILDPTVLRELLDSLFLLFYMESKRGDAGRGVGGLTNGHQNSRLAE